MKKSVFYIHPDHVRRPIWKRIWIRLCRYVVDGGNIGVRGFMTKSRALDFFYDASNKNETSAPINIQRKRIGAKMEEIA